MRDVARGAATSTASSTVAQSRLLQISSRVVPLDPGSQRNVGCLVVVVDVESGAIGRGAHGSRGRATRGASTVGASRGATAASRVSAASSPPSCGREVSSPPSPERETSSATSGGLPVSSGSSCAVTQQHAATGNTLRTTPTRACRVQSAGRRPDERHVPPATPDKIHLLRTRAPLQEPPERRVARYKRSSHSFDSCARRSRQPLKRPDRRRPAIHR